MMAKQYRIFEWIVNVIGVLSIIACILIIGYWTYYEYFYVNTQPIRVYAGSDVTKILDYYNHDESKMNVLKKNSIYTFQNGSDAVNPTVFACKEGFFAFDYLLESKTVIKISKGVEYFPKEKPNLETEEVEVYLFRTDNSIIFSFPQSEDYSGPVEVTSAEIIEFAKQNKWTAKFNPD